MTLQTALDETGLPPLRKIIAQYGLAARKGLGQHFLLDLNLTKRIVSQAGNLTGINVFEIGPGPGGLTRALVESQASQIIAIEMDPRCVLALGSLVQHHPSRLRLIQGDALKTDLLSLAPAPRAIIANLPYNVGTELLLGWLRQAEAFTSMTLMFQLEVADRIAAEPRTKAYGRLAVIAQFCCNVKRVMKIPARAFTPPPKVDSAVVHLTPRQDRPADVSLKALERITAAAFGQRRKMLRSSMKPLGGEMLLAHANIDPQKRAEELSLADFEQLARALQSVNLSLADPE
ncbi:MAG: 16S rRNA (adenine(1518)-N(6)/adenine(1519)-N(6))-dimethyltransferase RsmA [Alphaproteobacteria bacterium]|nr:16S rRNA (adenine(1518)-N(6)/adenine(1519)-N(6))-dimethyltransferase RsmA [Alphaproteobacteria bacterium]